MNTLEHSIPIQTIQELHEDFRKAKHDISNTFAVLLALAELAERNPLNYERLAKAVLERCPKVLQELQNFQEALANIAEASPTGRENA
ncbi:MAG: hypothetical protein WCO60_07750 [Verrucomicrobiota bacterium]